MDAGMRMDAVPEVHPWLLLSAAGLSNRALMVSAIQMSNNPYVVLEDGFWSGLYVTVREEGAGAPEGLVEARRQRLALARDIWAEEIDLIRTTSPTTIYLEGDGKGVDVLDVAARDAGHAVVYLDEGSPHFPLDDAHDSRGQSDREGTWLEKMVVSQQMPAPVLIAGASHIEGKYGLPERLRAAGISLNIIDRFAMYAWRDKELNDELRRYCVHNR